MPLPLLLWAGGLIAGAGVVKGVGAMSDFEDAKRVGKSAEKHYRKAKDKLENQRIKTNSDFENLGRVKLSVFTTQIKHLVQVVNNSGKNARSRLSHFNQDFSVQNLKDMGAFEFDSLKIENGLVSGAVAGVLVGLGPALAVGGFMLASKAEEALTLAREYEAEVDIAIAKIKGSRRILEALSVNAHEMSSALIELAQRFDVVKVDDDSDLMAFEKMFALGMALKNIANTPIMESDGNASENVKAKISGYLEI